MTSPVVEVVAAVEAVEVVEVVEVVVDDDGADMTNRR
jgi:TusA-related sulfurtransferase